MRRDIYRDIYGPYTRKDGRKIIVTVAPDGKKTSKSYPKFLVEQHIGRLLDSDETVDHVDRNFSNDELENLCVLPRRKHSHIDVKRAKLVEITCQWCGTISKKKGNNLRANSKKGKAGPFCGKSCAGKYSRSYQLGRSERKNVQPSPESEYFYLNKNTAL